MFMVEEMISNPSWCRFYKKLGDSCTKYPESDMMCMYKEKEHPRCKWYYNPDHAIHNTSL